MTFITKALVSHVLERHSFLSTVRWIVSDRVERIVCHIYSTESITNWSGTRVRVWSYRPLESWHPVQIVRISGGCSLSVHFSQAKVGFAEWLVLLNDICAIRHNHGSVTIWNVCSSSDISRSTTKRHPLVLIGGRIVVVVLSQSEHHVVLNCCLASVAALVTKSNIQQATIALFDKSFIVLDWAWQKCIDSGRPVLDRHIFKTLCSLVLILARLNVNNCLRFIRVEWFQIEKLFREVWHTIEGDQVGHALFAISCETRATSPQATIAFWARLSLANLQGHECFPALDCQWALPASKGFCWQVDRVLELEQGAKFRVVVCQVIVPIHVFVDECMVSRNWNVVDDSDVTVLTSANLDFDFAWVSVLGDKLLRIDYVEHFFLIIAETFENDKILGRLLDSNDVDDLVLVSNLEGQDLLANLTINFVELKHHLAFVDASLSFRLQPWS